MNVPEITKYLLQTAGLTLVTVFAGAIIGMALLDVSFWTYEKLKKYVLGFIMKRFNK
jgi:hypothetical protein